MSRRIVIVSLFFAWLCANGAIWDAVQVFAWGKMFASYSETMTISAALKETLDPSKTCEICVAVAAGKQGAENDLPAAGARDASKFVLALESIELPSFAADSATWPDGLGSKPPQRIEPVRVRPPRV